MNDQNIPDLNIMLAEDDDSTRQLLRNILSDAGCKVIAAESNGEDLWKVFNDHKKLHASFRKLHIVMLDISMPGKFDGLDVLKLIRAIDKDIYVVMVSGETEVKLVKEVIASGASGFIAKPFTPARIRGMINDYIKKTGNKG